jgi:uncharacterized protein (TIGR03435 family)
MFSAAVRAWLMAFTGCLLYGQSAYGQSFDVASIKPAAPPPSNGRGMVVFSRPTGGPGTNDPGRIRYPNMSLKNLLMSAYDVKNFQITGPAWLDTERFDIDATMPPETTRAQFHTMLQNLLAERFKLNIHRESKELPMYSLVVAKNGSKLKESAAVVSGDGDAPPPPEALPDRPKIGPDGFPIIPVHRGLFGIMMPGRARLIGQQQSMQDLATRLTDMLNRPVTDATELTAKYDFVLTYSPEGLNGPMGPMGPMPPPGGAAISGPAARPSDAEPLVDIFGAVQADLGLKLETKKGSVEMIVVDHAEKVPTEN